MHQRTTIRATSGKSATQAYPIFPLNQSLKMCLIQDVYHTQCGHWAERPRIERSCAAVRTHLAHGSTPSSNPGMLMTQPCYNSKTDGFYEDRKDKCPKCRINVDQISLEAGTWLSCGIDKATGKPYFRERKPECDTSRRARSRQRTHDQTQSPIPSPAPEKSIALPKLRPRPMTLKSKPEDLGPKPMPLSPSAEYWWKQSREDSDRKSSACSWSSHGHVEL